jgi:hypothetical protein
MPVSAAIPSRADQLRDDFLSAQPFRHIVVDDFFEEGFASRLLDEFPRFDKGISKAESGEAGGKAIQPRIAAISPSWNDLYNEISSPPFLDLISRMSGIPDLIVDPHMFGGGTHENLHDQELDPHVDFNYDITDKLHRRLNLIVYLNKGWKSEWGGALEIHSNPRRPDENQIRGYDPIFNRAILFETNEYSWHGFPRITLPEEERHRSRKSISIYLYTKDRPAEEIAPRHATFYVQRPLPDHYAENHTLTAEDVAELKRQFIRRDRWIELYQQRELEASREIREMHDRMASVASSARVPLTGYAKQQGPVTGFHSDLWAEPEVRLRVEPIESVSRLMLHGFRIEGSAAGSLIVRVDGVEVGRGVTGSGNFTVACEFPKRRTDPFDVELRFDGPLTPGGSNDDDRRLAWVFLELRAIHPVTTVFRLR